MRSDNIAYNEKTGEVKFVDWNWASYAPKKFGATEFLIDMARSLKPPLTPGSTLREMQAETAAVVNYLYQQLR